MIFRRETEPRGELSSGTEVAGLRYLQCQHDRSDRTDAGNRGQAPTDFAAPVPSFQFSLEIRDYLDDCFVLSGQDRKQILGHRWDDTAQETLGFFDVTSPLGLVAHNVGSNVAVWTDLGSGMSYGSYTFDVAGDENANFYIPLNGDALAAIQSSIGDYFTVGAAVTPGEGFVFGGSGAHGTQALVLQVSVPEPATVVTLFVGLFALGVAGRRKSKPAF